LWKIGFAGEMVREDARGRTLCLCRDAREFLSGRHAMLQRQLQWQFQL
jgi:hypothetical protein